MPASVTTIPEFPASYQPPHAHHGSPMPLPEAEAAIEAALLNGAKGSGARSKGVELFLATSAELIAERMHAAGLAVVRRGG